VPAQSRRLGLRLLVEYSSSMLRLNRGLSLAFAVATGIAVFAVPKVAWAPPICRGVAYHVEQFNLRAREATADGVAVPLPTGQFVIASRCEPDSLSGTLADVDPTLTNGRRETTWVRTP
jgi:hypothetical protein